MKKKVIFSVFILILAIIIYVIVSQYISKLNDDIDEDKQDENSIMVGCVSHNVYGAKVVSVDGENEITIVLGEDTTFTDWEGKEHTYKKGQTAQIRGFSSNYKEQLEDYTANHIASSIKKSADYYYLPWTGDKIDITYLTPENGIESASIISAVEYGSRITGTVVSTRVLEGKPYETGKECIQNCATIKISDISCEQECTFKKGDIVEVMYGGVYIDGVEQSDKELHEGDTISYGFGRHDSERYGEYDKEDAYVMTPSRVDFKSEKAMEAKP